MSVIGLHIKVKDVFLMFNELLFRMRLLNVAHFLLG